MRTSARILVSEKDFIRPFCSYYDYLKNGKRFDPLEEIMKTRKHLFAVDLVWAVINSPKLKKNLKALLKRAVDKYGNAEFIYSLLRQSPLFGTPEMVAAFLAASPTVYTLYCALRYVSICETPEMVAAFLAASPTAEYLYYAMRDCSICQTPEVVAAFLAASPTAEYLYYAMRDCPICQTEEMKAALKAAEKAEEGIIKFP